MNCQSCILHSPVKNPANANCANERARSDMARHLLVQWFESVLTLLAGYASCSRLVLFMCVVDTHSDRVHYTYVVWSLFPNQFLNSRVGPRPNPVGRAIHSVLSCFLYPSASLAYCRPLRCAVFEPTNRIRRSAPLSTFA